MRIATLGEILPFVRYFHTVQAEPHFYGGAVIPYDHRLFFLRRGTCGFSLGDTEYIASASDLIFIPSGKPYRLHSGGEALEMIAVNFDFFYDHAHMDFPIPPERSESFSQEGLIERVEFSDVPAFNDYLILPRQSGLLDAFRRMEEEILGQGLYYREQTSAYLKEILTQVARAARCGDDTGSRRVVNEVIALIREKYDQPIDNAQIAAALNYHPNYLNRLMQRHTHYTLHQYLLNYRFDRALGLLMMTDLPLAEVATRAGFADVSHFSKLFRKRTGQSPGKFRTLQNNFNNKT